jgi:hypothetical protein
MQIPLQPKEEKKELSFLEHLGNTAAGAASGFAQGGPIGAVVGGGSALYKSMKTQEFDPIGSAVGPASLVSAGKEAGVLTDSGITLEGVDPLKAAALGKGFLEGDGFGALGTIGTIQQAEQKRALEAKKLAMEGITSETLYDKKMNPRVVTRSKLGEVLTIDGRKATPEDDPIIKDLRPLEALKETRATIEGEKESKIKEAELTIAKERNERESKKIQYEKDLKTKEQAKEDADRTGSSVTVTLSDGTKYTARPDKKVMVELEKLKAETERILNQLKIDPSNFGMTANEISQAAIKTRELNPKLTYEQSLKQTIKEIEKANPRLLHQSMRKKTSPASAVKDPLGLFR